MARARAFQIAGTSHPCVFITYFFRKSTIVTGGFEILGENLSFTLMWQDCRKLSAVELGYVSLGARCLLWFHRPGSLYQQNHLAR